MKTSGSNELLEQIQNNNLCVGCGACVGICPYFKAHMGKVAMTFSCDRTEGRCYAHCPCTETDYDTLSNELFNVPYEEKPIGNYIKIYGAKAGEKLNGKFQNGGTVTALMTFAMEKGYIDSAVLTDSKNMIPDPKIVTNSKEIGNFSSTKYMASPTVSKFNEAMEKGFEKIGVVGTPCQMTAIGKIKSNPLKRETFKKPDTFLVGLFCTWAVDTRSFKKLLETKTDISKIKAMDIPPPPAETFVLKTEGQDIEIPLDDIRNIVPEGCSLCPDMTCEWSDVAVGAYEGKKGWNTLIVRTKKGEEIINQAVEQGYLEVEEFPSENLKHLSSGSEGKRERGLLKREESQKSLGKNDNGSDTGQVVGFR